MFSTAELPVPLDPDEKQAQLQIVYAINSIVTVKPPKAKPDVRVAEVDRKTSSKGVQGVDVVFQNDGPAHAYIGTDTLQLSSGSWHVTLDAGAFGKAVGLELVPPNAKRAMFIPLADVRSRRDPSPASSSRLPEKSGDGRPEADAFAASLMLAATCECGDRRDLSDRG